MSTASWGVIKKENGKGFSKEHHFHTSSIFSSSIKGDQCRLSVSTSKLKVYIYEVKSSLPGSCLALKWFMRLIEIDRLKRSLVQWAHHTSSCFHVIIKLTCRTCLRAYLYAVDAPGTERSFGTWVLPVMCGQLLVSPHLYIFVFKGTAGEFLSLAQPVSLGLNHELYFSILQSGKISSSMIIKSVDQILSFLPNAWILLKSAELKGMQLWAESIPSFFLC